MKLLKITTTFLIVFTIFFTVSNKFTEKISADGSTTTAGIAITVEYDGSAPFDSNDLIGNDSSANNLRVRAGQIIGYKIDLNLVDSTGSTQEPYSNLTATLSPLPLGYTWSSIPAGCNLGSGGSLSGDGINTPSVLICNTGTRNTGEITSIYGSVRALPSMIEATTITLTGTASATGAANTTTASASTVTGTTTPKIDLQKGSIEYRGTKLKNGVAGTLWYYGIGIKLKPGSEVPQLPITFTDDISGISPNAELDGCGVSTFQVQYFPFGKIGNYSGSNATNAVADSGTITCTADLTNPQTINISIAGTNTNPTTFPTSAKNGNTIASSDMWVISDYIAIFIPFTDLNINPTTGNYELANVLNMFKNFSPIGLNSGNANFGGAGDPGANLTNEDTLNTALYGTENGYVNVITLPPGGIIIKRDYKYTNNVSSTNLIGDGNLTTGNVSSTTPIGSTDASGDGVVPRGGLYSSSNIFYPNGKMTYISGSMLCTKIDNRYVEVYPLPGHMSEGAIVRVDNPTLLDSFTDLIVEYGVGGVNGVGANWTSDNALMTANCENNESTGGLWYSDLNSVPGGAAAVTKIRVVFGDDYTIAEQLNYQSQVSNSSLVLQVPYVVRSTTPLSQKVANHLGFKDAALQWQPTNGGWIDSNYNIDTALGNSLGDRITVVGAKVRLNKTISDSTKKSDTLTTDQEALWMLWPNTESMGATPPGFAQNVVLTDTLPQGITYIAGTALCSLPTPISYQIAPLNCEPTITYNIDGSTTLTWNYGDVEIGKLFKIISFRTEISNLILSGTVKINTAVISADNDPSLESWRTSTATLQVINTSAFSVEKSTVKPLIEPQDTIEFYLGMTNTGQNPVPSTDLIDWLPWNGDQRTPATNYHGTTILQSVSYESGVVPTNILFTKHDKGTLSLPNDLDPISINPAIVWCTQLQFGNIGCPTTLSEVTGLRIQTGLLNGGDSSIYKLVMKPQTNSPNMSGDIYTNQFILRASGLALPAVSNNVPVQVLLGEIGDYAWIDSNFDGIMDEGELPLAGVFVELLDINDTVIDSVVTGNDGLYLFENLVHGDYKIRFTPPAGYTYTYPNTGNDTADSDASLANGISQVITLNIGESDITIDAGFVGSSPSISVVKRINGDDANSTPGLSYEGGSELNITFEITNTGNTILNNILLEDNVLNESDISCPKTTLIPQESITCTSVFTLPNNAGQHTNIANVTGTPPTLPNGNQPPNVTDSDPANAFVPALPGISLIKLINGNDANITPGIYVLPNTPLNIEYQVANTGNVQLNHIVITDDMIATSQINCPSNVLAVGGTMTCTASFTSPAGGIQHTNTGTVTGTPSPTPNNLHPSPISDSDPANALSINPAINIIKRINGEDANVEPGIYVSAGTLMEITFEVTNIGNITLNDIVVSDTHINTSDINCPKTILLPMESMICTATLIAPENGQHTNTGVVTATPSPLTDGTVPDSISSDDPANAMVSSPKIGLLKKLISSTELGSNQFKIKYELRFKNMGNMKLHNLQVKDNLRLAFPVPIEISNVVATTDNNFQINSLYDGVTDDNVLIGTDSLGILEEGVIMITLDLKIVGTSRSVFWNSATIKGTSDLSETVIDISDDNTENQSGYNGNNNNVGTDQPDDLNNRTNPGNILPNRLNDPTPVQFEIKLADTGKRNVIFLYLNPLFKL